MGNIMMPPTPPMSTTKYTPIKNQVTMTIDDDISDIAEPPVGDKKERGDGDSEVSVKLKLPRPKSKRGGGKKKKSVEINL